MALIEDDQPVECLMAQSLDRPLTVSVGSGTPIRCWRDSGANAAKHLVELIDELGVAIVDGELQRSLETRQFPGQIADLLSDPGRVGVCGAVGVEDAPAMDLHEYDHVERLEYGGVDGEEVTGQDGTGLGGQKLGPARSLASRGRRHPLPPKNSSCRVRCDLITELEQFSLDPAIAPTRILTGQAQDQLFELVADRGATSTWAPTISGPVPAYQLPMPAQQGTGREDEASCRQPPAERSQDQPVGW